MGRGKESCVWRLPVTDRFAKVGEYIQRLVSCTATTEESRAGLDLGLSFTCG